MGIGRRLLNLSVFLVLALLAGAAAFALPVRASVPSSVQAEGRDLWFVVIHQGDPIASAHVEVTLLDDGTLRYAWISRNSVNFLGQQQETTISTELLVSSELRPLSLRSETSALSGVSTIRGEVVDNVLSLTSLTDGEESTSEMHLDEEHPLIFDSCLAEWLTRQPERPVAVTVQVIDDSTWKLATLTATAQASEGGEAVWRVEPVDRSYAMTLRVGADGFEMERVYEFLGVQMKRSSKEEASQVKASDQTGRMVLSFPVEPPITAPHLLTDLTVELRWDAIPFADFELEDDRQRLLEYSLDGTSARALVNISAPDPVEPDVPFPVEREGFEATLGETEYVKPLHPDIQEVAARVTQDEGSALAAVQALSAWVFEYIDATLIAETLSGPQVLVRKVGKCTEYSTLFASLARSAGIPTRLALGERRVGGQWGGHMWNEVYVGRWIPVDASVNEVGASLALLKFIHSDTVAGTQPLRWALTESLDIRVHDFTATESRLAGTYVTGIDGSTYTNAEFECRITAPRSDWKLRDATGADGNVTIRFEIPGAESVFIHLVAFPIPVGLEAKALAESRIGMFSPGYDGFEVETNEPVVVKDASGHTTCFRGAAKGSEVESGITEYVWTQGSFGYLLNMIATKTEHDEQLADFDRLLASFEFLTPE